MNIDTITHLESIIAERRNADPSTSYVASLNAKGREKMAQKVGEEAVEAVIAAMADDSDALIGESADLVFHLLVLLAEKGISWQQVMDELASREGVSGLVEKAARPKE
ncbi:MAG: phosphoribosyl-ATP diphosphatase [Pseudomonadota bacterium]